MSKEKLLADQCWLDVGSWRDGVDLPGALARYDDARSRLAMTTTTTALASAAALPYELAAAAAPRRPVHELIAEGEVELIRGVRVESGRFEGDGEPPSNRRGDVVVSVSRRFQARAVSRGGAVILAPDQCLRFHGQGADDRRPAVGWSGVPALRRGVRPRPALAGDDECERIVAALDHLAAVRERAAAVADDAEALTARTLEALAAGAVPFDGGEVDRATGIDRSGGYATDASGAKPGRSRAPTLG